MDNARPSSLLLGLSSLLAVSAACATSAPDVPVASADASASKAPPAITEAELKGSVQAAARAELEWNGTSTDTLFEMREWKQGAAGFIALENEELDTALIAWTARGSSVSVRVVAQAHDGSGAGVQNLIEVENIAIDDVLRGTVSASVAFTSVDNDPGACSTSTDYERHLVVCAGVEEFLCGGLRVEVQGTLALDSTCCEAESIPTAECPSTAAHSSQTASATFTDGNWSVGTPEAVGTKPAAQGDSDPVELAAKGEYSVEAFTNTFTLPVTGLEL